MQVEKMREYAPEEDGDDEGDDASDDHKPKRVHEDTIPQEYHGNETHHCQGMSVVVLICSVPYATRPNIITAIPFMRTTHAGCRQQRCVHEVAEWTYTSTRHAASAPGACRTSR